MDRNKKMLSVFKERTHYSEKELKQKFICNLNSYILKFKLEHVNDDVDEIISCLNDIMIYLIDKEKEEEE
ncbi:unknown [Gryllus bimaculatus nudivirus]|uniref:Uncharacterized protein n=1 Tax=Gryllus bimaculatus nudivirus TaxID=432587 RepID=A4L1X1_9VIRU|nr:hypothetical protein GrBNV_gp08 [Gryllus bimaculatus nudivirus]ABO45341.1 unknown [Gryllus bimaculatus nudivirus]